MSSIILKSLVAAAVLVSAAPVLAAAGTPPTTTLKYDAKMQKYCLIEPAITGTRLQRKTCKTATQWTADGLDMPKTTMIAQR